MTEDGILRTWRLDIDPTPVDVAKAWAEVVSGRRIDEKGRPLALDLDALLERVRGMGGGAAGGDTFREKARPRMER